MKFGKLIQTPEGFFPVTVDGKWGNAKAYELPSETTFTPIALMLCDEVPITAFVTVGGAIYVPLPFLLSIEEGKFPGMNDDDSVYIPNYDGVRMCGVDVESLDTHGNVIPGEYELVRQPVRVYKIVSGDDRLDRYGYPDFKTVFIDDNCGLFISDDDVDF